MNWRHLLLILAALCVGAGAGYPLLADLYGKPIRSVRIAGEFKHVARSELQDAIGEHLSKGFFKVNVTAVRRAALQLPWIKRVSVRRVWPDSLHVAVVERVASARWNASQLIDADGALFSPAEVGDGMRIPWLAGPQHSEKKVLASYQEFEPLFRSAGFSIDRLERNPAGGWRVKLRSGLSVLLGKGQGSADLERVLPAFPALIGRYGERLRRVDLRYASGFAVQLANDGARMVQG